MQRSRSSHQRAKRLAPYFGSRTDIGCVRDHNEDSLIVAPPLFAVADGMGGHAAGEVASEIAVTTLLEKAPTTADARALGLAVEDANRAVMLAADERKGRAGMGTTMTAAVLESTHLVIAHVGDSRAYLLHQGKLQQITRDHSLMADMIEAGQITPEEARVHPMRSKITRALGSDARMMADLFELEVEAGDRLLLCSDGLSSMLTDHEIESILARQRNPQLCASVLVNEANAAGGLDNITVIVVDVTGKSDKHRRRMVAKSRLFMGFMAFCVVALMALACAGTYFYIHTTAYLTAEDGKVVIYRGMPDDLFGAKLSWFERKTDVNVSDLQTPLQTRLEQGGIRVDSVEAANKLVADYESEIKEKQEQEEKKRRDEERKKLKAQAEAAAESYGASSEAQEDSRNSDGAGSSSGADGSQAGSSPAQTETGA